MKPLLSNSANGRENCGGSFSTGFTLLEICLAIMIALLLVSAAVPSIGSLLAEREQKKSFEAFDELVREAQRLSIETRRAVVLVWEKGGVLMRYAEKRKGDEDEVLKALPVAEGAVYDLKFPAALVDKPDRIWTFWPSGACEPVVIRYGTASVGWMVDYDPLTAQARTFELYDKS